MDKTVKSPFTGFHMFFMGNMAGKTILGKIKRYFPEPKGNPLTGDLYTWPFPAFDN